MMAMLSSICIGASFVSIGVEINKPVARFCQSIFINVELNSAGAAAAAESGRKKTPALPSGKAGVKWPARKPCAERRGAARRSGAD
jgi:hypothetical protein